MDLIPRLLLLASMSGLGLTGWVKARERRALAARFGPPIAIGDALDDRELALEGRVVFAEATVRAPYSGRRCCAFTAELSRYQDFGDGMGSIARRDVRTDFAEFDLQDESGVARVVLSAQTELVKKEARLLTADNDRWERWEWVLCEGDRVVIHGVPRWEAVVDGAPRSYREAPRRLRVEAIRLTHVVVG